jgi:putative membrane protein
MATDFVLAVLHHILVFGLVAQIVAVAALLRMPLSADTVSRIARLDAATGATAGAVLVVGILRVVFGAKGYGYYLGNPWFWAKMASFAAVALLSIRPTMTFLAWRRAARLDAAFAPPAAEATALRRVLRAESVLIVLVLVFAAAMARFG